MPTPTPPATVRLLPGVFAGLGVVLLLATVVLYGREQRFVTRAARATGIVTALDRRSGSRDAYHPVVAFRTATGDSVSFRSSIGSNPPSYHVEDTVTVLYDPANPADARIAGLALHLGSLITGLLALVFGGTGGIWLWLRRRAAAFVEEMRYRGRRVQARVVQIERRTNIRVGTRNPYRIVAQWHDASGGVERTGRSANIWFDPTEHVGETVNVFVDPDDPRSYVVDLDFLPQAH